MTANKPASGSPLRQFISQSVLLWLAQMGGIVISAVAGIFITRALGPEGRGVYTWLLTLAGVGASVALFGMDISNRRFAAAHSYQIPALVRLNLWVILGGGGLVSLALALVAYHQPASGQVPLWIALVILTVPLGALTMALGQILVAQERIMAAAMLNFLPKLGFALAAGAVLVLAGAHLGAILAINFAAIAGGALMVVYWLHGHFRERGHLEPVPYLKTIWRTCSAAYVSGLSYYLMQKVDVLLVGYYLGKTATGFYGVASNLVDIMITPVAVIANLLAARISAGQGGRFLRSVVGITMAITVAGCLFTYVIAPVLVPFLYGQAFSPAVPVLQLLCLAVVALAWFMLMQNALVATGRARYLAIPPTVGCLLNVALNVYLLPRFDLVGACWASVLAYGLAAACATGLLLWEREKRGNLK